MKNFHEFFRKLKENRNKLNDECNHLHRTRKRELDVEVKRDQLTQLENRIKATVVEYRRIENQNLGRLEHELEALQGEIEVVEVYIINFIY